MQRHLAPQPSQQHWEIGLGKALPLGRALLDAPEIEMQLHAVVKKGAEGSGGKGKQLFFYLRPFSDQVSDVARPGSAALGVLRLGWR